jgi:c-di-GMP-binding flagellar brake protein YcgR
MRKETITAGEVPARARADGAERRRFVRKRVLWAASIEVRGERLEGVITDLSAGGARLRFAAPLTEGEELRLILSEFDAMGAKVVWQRDGEAGVQFVLAPSEVLEALARRQVAGEARDAAEEGRRAKGMLARGIAAAGAWLGT